MMLPIGPFSVIYADPPWQFRSWSDRGRNRCPDALVRQKGLAERHYKVMRIEDLWELPVESIALPDSALFMWVVSSHLDQALDLGRRWGFTYKAIVFNWVKLYPIRVDLLRENDDAHATRLTSGSGGGNCLLLLQPQLGGEPAG